VTKKKRNNLRTLVVPQALLEVFPVAINVS